MNKTQQVIILIGNRTLTSKVLDVIRGFKAVTIVESLTEETISNVFHHNKNVVFTLPAYALDLNRFSPILVHVTNGNTNPQRMQLGITDVINDFPTLMDSVNVDVGDHISQNSTSSEVVKHNCLLCKIAEGHPEKPEHILYESENFFVIPGLGAFFDGYVMIVPKEHVMSFAELKPDQYAEFLDVLSDMRFILESVYHKPIFVFECGSGRNGGGKHATSIVHAHIHLAPTDMPVLRNVQNSGLYPSQIEPTELCKYGEYPYMLYIDQSDRWYITSDSETYFPRQHPRQVLADYMNLPKGQYNWRTNPLRDKMDVIADEIYSFLKEHFLELPVWIQEAVKKFL